jgi:hypothetical protein
MGVHRDLAAAVRDQVSPALVAGINPASLHADPVVAAVTAQYAHVSGDPDDINLRRRLLTQLETANDPRRERYLQLLAVVNRWQAPESLAPALNWFIQALRARTASWRTAPHRHDSALNAACPDVASGRYAAGADDFLALVVPAAHGGHRVAEDVEIRHDVAHADGLGEGVGGVVGADALQEPIEAERQLIEEQLTANLTETRRPTGSTLRSCTSRRPGNFREVNRAGTARLVRSA